LVFLDGMLRFPIVSRPERYITRFLNHQAGKGEPQKDVFKSKGFSIKIALLH
jgi:hypothetical protein